LVLEHLAHHRIRSHPGNLLPGIITAGVLLVAERKH